jgi:hypothetical protein
MGFFRFLFLMPGDVISRARKGRHRGRGRPALVARRPVEHRDADTFEPKAEFDAVGPGHLRPDHDGSLDSWLADDKSEADLALEEAEYAYQAYRETRQVMTATLPVFAQIDEVLVAFMHRHGISWDDVRSHGVDVAATVVFEAVDGDIHRLAEELATEVAVSTPTGEWPIVRTAVA